MINKFPLTLVKCPFVKDIVFITCTYKSGLSTAKEMTKYVSCFASACFCHHSFHSKTDVCSLGQRRGQPKQEVIKYNFQSTSEHKNAGKHQITGGPQNTSGLKWLNAFIYLASCIFADFTVQIRSVLFSLHQLNVSEEDSPFRHFCEWGSNFFLKPTQIEDSYLSFRGSREETQSGEFPPPSSSAGRVRSRSGWPPLPGYSGCNWNHIYIYITIYIYMYNIYYYWTPVSLAMRNP